MCMGGEVGGREQLHNKNDQQVESNRPRVQMMLVELCVPLLDM